MAKLSHWICICKCATALVTHILEAMLPMQLQSVMTQKFISCQKFLAWNKIGASLQTITVLTGAASNSKGPSATDVTQIWRFSDPLPPAVTLKCLFYLGLHTWCHKRVNPFSPCLHDIIYEWSLRGNVSDQQLQKKLGNIS